MTKRYKRALTLVADMGGTNCRLAMADKTSLIDDSIRRYTNRDYENPKAIIDQYLHQSTLRPTGACIAVAGPLINPQQARLTNISWDIDSMQLSQSLGGLPIVLINDLQAVGHALHLIKAHQLTEIVTGSKNPGLNPRLVINVGTGFNAVAVHNCEGSRLVAPSECGHASLPTFNPMTARLKRFIERKFSFASVEDVLSGRGTKMIHKWLSSPLAKASAPPAVIYDQIFAMTLGAASRNLALTHLPTGGIYLTGGLINAKADALIANGFQEQFRDAGRFSDFMAQFSVRVIRDNDAALRGCAAAFEAWHTT